MDKMEPGLFCPEILQAGIYVRFSGFLPETGTGKGKERITVYRRWLIFAVPAESGNWQERIGRIIR